MVETLQRFPEDKIQELVQRAELSEPETNFLLAYVEYLKTTVDLKRQRVDQKISLDKYHLQMTQKDEDLDKAKRTLGNEYSALEIMIGTKMEFDSRYRYIVKKGENDQAEGLSGRPFRQENNWFCGWNFLQPIEIITWKLELPLERFKEIASACVADKDARTYLFAQWQRKEINYEIFKEELTQINQLAEQNKTKLGKQKWFLIYSVYVESKDFQEIMKYTAFP